ncbi:MAG: hypothetical protein O2851_07640, partial [Proteobacteria bacterium]|nr:hypothetical protein [Pseudomonadota bacterium]
QARLEQEPAEKYLLENGLNGPKWPDDAQVISLAGGSKDTVDNVLWLEDHLSRADVLPQALIDIKLQVNV